MPSNFDDNMNFEQFQRFSNLEIMSNFMFSSKSGAYSFFDNYQKTKMPSDFDDNINFNQF